MQINQYADQPDKLQWWTTTTWLRTCIGCCQVFSSWTSHSNLDAKLRMHKLFEEFNTKWNYNLLCDPRSRRSVAISDQIAVMKDHPTSRTTKELYHKPANEFVATFIGRTNRPSQTQKRATVLISSSQMAITLPYASSWSSWNKLFFVVSVPKEFIKDESGILKESFPIVFILDSPLNIL